MAFIYPSRYPNPTAVSVQVSFETQDFKITFVVIFASII